MPYVNTLDRINKRALDRIATVLVDYEERSVCNDMTVKKIKEIVQSAKDERRLLIQRNADDMSEAITEADENEKWG